MDNLIIFLLFIIFETISSQTISIPFSSLDKNETNVTISSSSDVGSCTCDLTDSCDYLCCCDKDCPSRIVDQWIQANNKCLTTGKSLLNQVENNEDSYLTKCFNPNWVYYFNLKRGMRNYIDSVTGKFCVTFDNSSIMAKFYKEFLALSNDMIKTIFTNYVDKEIHKMFSYGKQINQDRIAFSNLYTTGDAINVRNGPPSFTKDGKFYLYQAGPFGECVKTNTVRYMIPNERTSCGLKLKQFSQCADKSWDEVIKYPPFLEIVNGQNSSLANVTISNIYIRDYDTGLLSFPITFVPPSTNVRSVINTTECICDYLLEEVKFDFQLTRDSSIISSVFVEFILATNVRGECNQRKIFSQNYSSRFSSNYTTNIMRSGSPGYIRNKPLLIGYDITWTNPATFNVPQDGLFIVGSNNDGDCMNYFDNPSFLSFSNNDNQVVYGMDSIYSCKREMNITEFEDFCYNKHWKNLVLYNLPSSRIQFVGKLGSANYNFLQDWNRVLYEYNLDGSQYFTANNTCYFPSEILFDILTTQTGLISNPLETVVAARISVKYNYVTFDDVTTKQNVRMNFITSFIPLKEDVFAKKRSTPSILPGLPDDIATIFSLI